MFMTKDNENKIESYTNHKDTHLFYKISGSMTVTEFRDWLNRIILSSEENANTKLYIMSYNGIGMKTQIE